MRVLNCIWRSATFLFDLCHLSRFKTHYSLNSCPVYIFKHLSTGTGFAVLLSVTVMTDSSLSVKGFTIAANGWLGTFTCRPNRSIWGNWVAIAIGRERTFRGANQKRAVIEWVNVTPLAVPIMWVCKLRWIRTWTGKQCVIALPAAVMN